jgi:molybdopterin-guanine dinucleotide biosynthesis protein A
VTAAPTGFDAAILVGYATRLPGKFDLEVDGGSVLERVRRALAVAGFRATVVTVPGGRPPGPSVVVDRYDRGPLGGVRAFLETRSGPFLLVGGDMPFLKPEDLRTLRARHRPGVSVVPRTPDGWYEVLLAVYDLDLDQVVRYWEEGRSLQVLVSDLATSGQVDAIPAGELDARSFVDLDTPEDLARWRSATERPRASDTRP